MPEEGDEYLGGDLGQLLVRSCRRPRCVVVRDQEQGRELLLAVWRPGKKKRDTNIYMYA